MIEMTITQAMIDVAISRANRIQFDEGKDLSKFGSERKRTIVGYIGEGMLLAYLGKEKSEDDYEYDIVFNDKKLEVKTISCKHKPSYNYLCTVNSHDPLSVHKQLADYYVFTRILNDKSIGWLLGYISCKEFFKNGTYVEKGTEIATGINFVKANATVLEISKLYPIENLKHI